MKRRRRVVVDDVTRLRWPLDPALSPDGRRVAFVVSGSDLKSDRLKYDLYLVDMVDRSTKLVDVGRARQPAWSPDGNFLAYLVDRSGDWQIGVDLDGRDCEVDGSVVGFSWSPDARRIAAGSILDGTSMVWILEATSGDTTDVKQIPSGEVRQLHWSPSGEFVAVILGKGEGCDLIWLFRVDDDESFLLFESSGPIHTLTWSPDGSRIAAIARTRGPAGWLNNELWLLEASDSGKRRRLCPQLDRSIGQLVRGDDERGITPGKLAWPSPNSGILAMFADGGRSLLARVQPDGTWKSVVGGDRAILDFSTAPQTDQLVISWSDPYTPGELSIVDGDHEYPLTDLNGNWTSEVSLADTTQLTSVSSQGTSVDGWLTEPVGNDHPAPLVVQIHGGPHYPIGFRFSFDSQRLAGRGIALLRSNPRGSQGYGADHAEAIRGDWGGPDLEDLVTIVDEAAARPTIDETRLAIIGESYGGYLTNWAVAHSDRFRAAVSENGISDLTEMGRGRNGPGFWHLEMGGKPESLPDLYRERSPINHVEDVKTPLLLIHAEKDSTVPIGQSERLKDALARLGRNVSLHRIPEEEHFMNVYGSTMHRMTRMESLDQFLVEHLGPDSLDDEHVAETKVEAN